MGAREALQYLQNQKDLALADTAPPAPPASNPLRRVADLGVSAVKGTVVGIPETVVGLADLASGGRAGKLVGDAGVNFKGANQAFDDLLSPETVAAQKKVAEADGVVDKFTTAVKNPSVILNTVAESLPSMVAGAGVGRLALKAGLKSAALAAGIGEGAVTAGQNAEQVRQETPDGLLSPRQALLQAGAGVLTGAIGAGAGKLANRLGIGDAEVMMVRGSRAVGQETAEKTPGILKRIATGALTEGVLEELPQSTQEQIAQNLALDKPWNEGLDQAAVMGLLAGAAMGAGANVISKKAEIQNRLAEDLNNPSPGLTTAERFMMGEDLDTILPSPEAVTPATAQPVVDSEAATPQDLQSLLERRREAESRFDSANPVVPEAPNNTPIGVNPYQQFGATQTQPQATFTPSAPDTRSAPVVEIPAPETQTPTATQVPNLAPAWAAYNEPLTQEESDHVDGVHQSVGTDVWRATAAEVRGELAAAGYNTLASSLAITRETARRLGEQTQTPNIPQTPAPTPALTYNDSLTDAQLQQASSLADEFNGVQTYGQPVIPGRGSESLGRRIGTFVQGLTPEQRNAPAVQRLTSLTGIYSRINAPQNAGLLATIQTGSASEVLNHIKNNSLSSFSRDLAGALETALEGQMPSISLQDSGDSLGSYRASSHSITYYTRSSTEQAVLHELVHAATVRSLQSNAMIMRTVKNLVSDVIEATRDVDQRHYYGFDYMRNYSGGEITDTMAYEFMAEALSRREFQELLADTPITMSVTSPSIWTRLLEVVCNALGLTTSNRNITALDKAIWLGTRAINDGRMNAGLEPIERTPTPFTGTDGIEVSQPPAPAAEIPPPPAQDSSQFVTAARIIAENAGSLENFVRSLYGAGYNPTYFNSIATGPLGERIAFVRGWGQSENRDHVISSLEALQDAGVTSLADFYYTHSGITPTGVPSEAGLVSAPLTPAERDLAETLKNSLRANLAASHTNNPQSVRPMMKRLNNGAKKIWRSIAQSIDSYRFGSSNKRTPRGIVQDINEHFASRGVNKEVRVNINGADNPTTTPTTGERWTISINNGRGFVESLSGTVGGHTGAMQGREYAGDGALGYYVLQLMAKNIESFATRSSGLTPINQSRRPENAASFLFRYGQNALDDVSIQVYNHSGPGFGHEAYNITTNTSTPYSSLIVRTLRTALENYPELARYYYDFATGEIKTKRDNTAVHPNLIVAHIRSDRADYRSPVFDSFFNRTAPQVTGQGMWKNAVSTAVIMRAVINQTIYETLQGTSPVSRLNGLAMQAQENTSGPAFETLYSEGERLDNEIKPLTPKEKAFFEEIFGSENDLQELMQAVPSAMFEDGLFRIDSTEADLLANYIDETVRLEEKKTTLPPSFVKGTFAMRFVNHTTQTPSLEGVDKASQAKAQKLTTDLAPIVQRLSSVVPVEVVANPSMVPNLPANAPDFNAIYHEGTIYINAQNVSSQQEAESLILDHELRHHGLRQILGSKFKTLMQQVWHNKNFTVKEFAHQWGIDTTTQAGRLEAAEEFVVSLARDEKRHPALDRTIALIRNVLRSMGFSLKLSTSELRSLVAKAGELDPNRKVPSETRYSRIPSIQVADASKQLKSIGERVLTGVINSTKKIHHWLSPIDRLVDLSLSRSIFSPIAPFLKMTRTLNSELQSLQDRITSSGVTLYHNIMSALPTTEAQKNFNKLMEEGTLYGIYGYKAINEQSWSEDSWVTEGMIRRTGMTYTEAYEQVKSRWDALNQEQHDRYKEIIDHMKQTRERYKSEMIKLVEQVTPEGPERVAQIASIERKFNSIKGPYAPLNRFGNFIVQVYETSDNEQGEPSEDRIARYHFESQAEAIAFQREKNAVPGLRATFNVNTQIQTTRNELPTELMTKFAQAMEQSGITGEQLEDLKNDFNRVWMSLAPETSALKYSMRRSGLQGYNEDMLRSFMAYTQRHARAIAFLARGGAIRQNMIDMESAIDQVAQDSTANPQHIAEMKELVKSLKQHDQNVRTEKISPWVSALSKFPFIWYLARPSVYLVQSAQPFMLAAPRIARRFGYGTALSAVADHYRKQMSKGADGKPLYSNDRLESFADKANEIDDLLVEQRSYAKDSAPYRDVQAKINAIINSVPEGDKLMLGMKMATNRQAINITMVHEAQSIQNNDANDPLRNNSKWLMDKAGFFMQASELTSRKATFAAAFSLEYERSNDFMKATEYATELTLDTLYDYGTANRPTALHGNMGRILGQFQIFRLHTIFKITQLAYDSFLKRTDAFVSQAKDEFGVASYVHDGTNLVSVTPKEGVTLTPEQKAEFGARIDALMKEKPEARKELAFMLGSTVALAGTSGLPFLGTVFGALSLLGALGGDDDDPMDVEMEFNKYLRSIPGGEVAEKGLPALLGWDLSRRVGMSGMFDLFQGDPPENLKGAEKAAWYASKATGPVGGVVTDMFRAQQAFSEGDWGKGLVQASPSFVRDLAKGYKLASGEGFKTGSGKTLIPEDQITVYETALAMVGINPLKLSLASEDHADMQKVSTRISDRKNYLSKQFSEAVAAEDDGARQRAAEEIASFNKNMPSFAFKGSELVKAVRIRGKKENGVDTKFDAKVRSYMEGA